ncbi:hypothetical protein AAKU55_005475 [Oxalobacteraceae bacterium GrIS 1.11]
MNKKTNINSNHYSEVFDAESDAMFIIEGIVTDLRTAAGTVNLLAPWQSSMAAIGIGNVIGGMDIGVVNAAMLATYGGEDVEKFVCNIGEHVVLGNFECVRFQDGDEVQAVASRIDDDVLFVHAVLRSSDELLWMPYGINKGRQAVSTSIAKLCGGVAIFGWVFVFIMFAFLTGVDKTFIPIMLGMTCALFGISAILWYLTYRSSVADALYAEKILEMLGFDNPKIVDLSPFCLAMLTRKERNPSSDHHTYRLRDALAAYRSLSVKRRN